MNSGAYPDMRNILARALAALTLLFAPAAWAQQTQADPALWVIKDRDTTIYLFGTVHVLKPGLTWFDEAVKQAFDKSGEVRIEMIEPDIATLQALIIKIALNPSGPTVTEQLPEDKRKPYSDALAEAGLPRNGLDRLDPWFSAVTLSVAMLPKYGYDPESGADKVIVRAAKAANKPVSAFETPEQQLGFFDGLSNDAQIKLLAATIDAVPRMHTDLDKMVANWAKGDTKALAANLNQDVTITPAIAKILLVDRNARWADWIAERMAQPGTLFIAVGAGHLAGRDSVQAFLRKHHLRAHRIRY
jgi:uncharacterized protein YbaP (TraB family)